jgi:citrate lyase beta subunit
MRHHRHAVGFPFVRPPIEFDKTTAKELLQYCLGGTLYMPGTRSIVHKILGRQLTDLTSMVMCFEDAISPDDLATAESNVLAHLDQLAAAVAAGDLAIADLPLIFLRARNTAQFIDFSSRLTPGQAGMLTGFVFPKFYSQNAHLFLDQLQCVNERLGVRLYGMPLLEGRAIAYAETRTAELHALKTILAPFKDLMLNIRIGGTDFSAIFGVRRGINTSIYDILPVRDVLTDILNFFNRADDEYTISGPVWEYFLADMDIDLDAVVATPIHRSLLNRSPILNEAVDGLLREVLLDKANGFIGKTVIHPSHLKYVNAMHAVTREEYDDARQILEGRGGVVKSATSNKMNEIKPHRAWAERIARCADAFGVIEDETCYLKLCLA